MQNGETKTLGVMPAKATRVCVSKESKDEELSPFFGIYISANGLMHPRTELAGALVV